MEQMQQHPRPYLFTLRLWQEELGQGNLEWRGRIQDVASGETAFFRDWPGLVGTLQRLVATNAAVASGSAVGQEPTGDSPAGARLATHRGPSAANSENE